MVSPDVSCIHARTTFCGALISREGGGQDPGTIRTAISKHAHRPIDCAWPQLPAQCIKGNDAAHASIRRVHGSAGHASLCMSLAHRIDATVEPLRVTEG
jgi:hypothetical protein